MHRAGVDNYVTHNKGRIRKLTPKECLKEYIPGYSSIKLKTDAKKLTLESDSLKSRLAVIENYTKSIKSVLTGEITSDDIIDSIQELGKRVQINENMLNASKQDSIFREKIESRDRFPLSDELQNRVKIVFSAKESGALISENRCFFSKTNFQKYLRDAKTEYFSQEQHYHNENEGQSTQLNFTEFATQNNVDIMTIYDASDNILKKQNRGYVRSDDKIWKLWRELILPSISYLSILKLVPIDDLNAEPLFYFRILLDYQFRSFVHPQSLGTEKELEKKEIEIGFPSASERIWKLKILGKK